MNELASGKISFFRTFYRRFFHWIRHKLVFLQRCAAYRKIYRESEDVLITGFPESKNFGDALNCFLIQYMSGKKVIPSRYIKKNTSPVYAVIGSILHWADSGSIVWGAGLISDEESASDSLDIRSVRGPKTRRALIEQGFKSCPAVYGDPAMLMPYIHHPDVTRVHEFGILPHYIDKEHPVVLQMVAMEGAHFIDIQTGSDVLPLIDQLLACKVIVTSSLHGLILAHAYQIPCIWVKLGDLKGGLFKFEDYLSSVGKGGLEVLILSDNVSKELLLAHLDDQPIKWDPAPLIEVCPFIRGRVKTEMFERIEDF